MMSGKQARHRGKRQPDPPPPPDLALPEADCQAAAPGIGRLNACHALKFIALTFAVMSIAFSADLISVFPAGAAPAAADSGGGGGGDAAAEQNWKPMAGERLQVVKPVVKQQESNAPVAAAAAAAAPAAAEPIPEMDAAPRSEPTMDYGLPKDHPYTPPEERQKTSLARPLRTADYYANYAGGVLHAAPRANVSDDDAIMTRRAHPNGPKRGWPEGVFRTHTADPDPIVATFDDFLSQEDAHRVIDAALPQMRRAGVTADNGGSRTSAGRSNDLTWLQHDHPAVRARPFPALPCPPCPPLLRSAHGHDSFPFAMLSAYPASLALTTHHNWTDVMCTSPALCVICHVLRAHALR